MSRLSPEQEAAWLAELDSLSPEEILAWAQRQFGERLALACSFGGVSGMALLDMAARVAPQLEVFTLDTGFLFPETHQLRERATRRYGIMPKVYLPMLTGTEPPELWKTQPDACCALRKVEPNRRALAGKDAWIVGLRRDQSETRAAVAPIAWDAQFGLYKIAPLWRWTEEEVGAYIQQYKVPLNALHADGYASIGCTHCTRPITDGEALRAGRWSGLEKTECGLHR